MALCSTVYSFSKILLDLSIDILAHIRIISNKFVWFFYYSNTILALGFVLVVFVLF